LKGLRSVWALSRIFLEIISGKNFVRLFCFGQTINNSTIQYIVSELKLAIVDLKLARLS
jgi:hypothetical protein